MGAQNPYDQRYAAPGYYWGHKPSAMCDRVIALLRERLPDHPRLIDLGCGEGRNAVYLAQHGFDVVGMDLSAVGLEKAAAYARQVGVALRLVQGDIVTYALDESYDVVFSSGALHYLPPEVRAARYADYRAHTRPGGLNALSVFVHKPFIPPAPDAEATAHHYRSGELLGYYWDWEILYSVEEIFDCMSSGVPHQHATNRIIARPR